MWLALRPPLAKRTRTSLIGPCCRKYKVYRVQSLGLLWRPMLGGGVAAVCEHPVMKASLLHLAGVHLGMIQDLQAHLARHHRYVTALEKDEAIRFRAATLPKIRCCKYAESALRRNTKAEADIVSGSAFGNGFSAKGPWAVCCAWTCSHFNSFMYCCELGCLLRSGRSTGQGKGTGR